MVIKMRFRRCLPSYEKSIGLASIALGLTGLNDWKGESTERKVARLTFGEAPVSKRARLSDRDGERNPPAILASSSSLNQPNETPVKTVEYDFVIIGNGNAGLSALRTLREACPSAKIAMIDSFRPITSTTKKLDYWLHMAVGFDPRERLVQLTDRSHQLRYRHGILVATGSRGAPPPPSLFDNQTWDRVLELRATESIENRRRPVLSPHTTRKLALMASSQGATVGVIGSGWEALELAVAASLVSDSNSNGKPMLCFGSAAPLSHILPRYLSTAVTKRLRQQGIEVQPRSLVRYVASDHKDEARLEVHTAKSYDTLDTKRTSVDLLVVAPYVEGPRGTAVLPTVDMPTHLQPLNKGQPWFQSWSQLTSSASDPSLVVSFDDDGRIMVNAELQAASGVYAAGSVAKYPNSRTGHVHVAGEGVDGATAGRTVALNMAQKYNAHAGRNMSQNILSGDDGCKVAAPSSFASNSFPLWRSDTCTYLQGETAKTTALADVGITAVCVGQCDSNRMSTHGFWWTNQSTQRLALNEAEALLDPANKRPGRRRKTGLNTQKPPVYGIGVVYYLDRTGRIRGIITWGLPYTSKASHSLNDALIDRMKESIRTNGGITQWDLEESSFLHSYHLCEEAKKLVALALAKGLVRRDTSRGMQRLMVPVEKMGKPLHRFTAAKPSIITGSVLRRSDGSSVPVAAPSENLYMKDEDVHFESRRPPNLTYVYPMQDPQESAKPANAAYSRSGRPVHKSQEERLQRALDENELRGRPPNEEPLWLRRGEAHKSVSRAQVLADLFIQNMRQGKFADGSDGLQRAPESKTFQNVKQTLSRWFNSDDGENHDSNDESQEDEEHG